MVEPEDDEIKVVVCGRKANGPSAIQDSVEYPCATCGETVLAAPTSVEVIQKHNAKTLCWECAVPGLHDENVRVLKPSPEQVKEILFALYGLRHRN